MIRSYEKAFPDLFSPFRAMPDALKDHLRYPEDLFTVQTNIYAKYHVLEPRRFFQGSERWLLSPDPNEAVSGGPAISLNQTTVNRRQTSGRSPEITATSARQPPYYLYIRLPSDDKESFLIIQPFVPVSNDNKQTRLVSFLTAKSDRDNYGKLEASVMPQGETVLGPVQAALKINQQPEIASRFTLLDQAGSRVIKGSVQLIPVGESIVYVQPIYIEGAGTSRFPQFYSAAVFVQDRDPVLAPTVNDGLNQIFGTAATPTPSNPTPSPTPSPAPTDTVANLLAQAQQKFADADSALRSGDLATYQALIKQGASLVDQAQALLAQSGNLPSTTTTTRSPAQPASAK
jgi:uncharacterized membrane protein (UPF0182 family)